MSGRRSVQGKPDFDGFYLDDDGIMVRREQLGLDAAGYSAKDRARDAARRDAERARARAGWGPVEQPSRGITNTTREAAENPLFMLGILAGGVSRGIEEQERNGQSELVQSTQLPYKMRGPKFCIEREPYEKIGIAFGEQVKGDPLFVEAKLPPGWRKVRTGHSLWSKVLDDKGRERISVFYKAASYDRDAFMDLVRRFSLKMNHNRDDYEKVRAWQVFDADKLVFEIELKLPDDLVAALDKTPYDMDLKQKRDEIDDQGRVACKEWLAERYPNWEDPTAHWDDP